MKKPLFSFRRILKIIETILRLILRLIRLILVIWQIFRDLL
ncbi:MAG TPA: hypothetical protein VN132_12205 [Bdellovibrio sp.]|nr:hypothetical protein [Bdellovibrio sp.]